MQSGFDQVRFAIIAALVCLCILVWLHQFAGAAVIDVCGSPSGGADTAYTNCALTYLADASDTVTGPSYFFQALPFLGLFGVFALGLHLGRLVVFK